MDSLWELRLEKVEMVPQSEVRLAIPLDSLRQLPQTAEFHGKQGQANVIVRKGGDTVYVYAVCDSLQRRCDYYERIAAQYKTALEKQTETASEDHSNGIRTALVLFLIGVVVGLAWRR